jgi:HD-GYP domain-containing protein (c-di-GMP phosphodiesterase class II)
MARLRVVSGSNAGAVHGLDMPERTDATSKTDNLVIGRDLDNGVIVADTGISRHHAEIFRIGDKYFLKDLDSKNGSFINDEQISLEMLKPGDKIRIGQTEFLFEESASGEDSSQVRYSSETVSAPTMVIDLKKLREQRPGAPPTEKTAASENVGIMYRASEIISAERNERKLMLSILELASNAVGAEEGHVILAAQAGEMTVKASIRKSDRPATVSRTIVKRVNQLQRSVLSQDAMQDERFKKGDSIAWGHVRSVLCAPLTVAGKSSGVLYLATAKPAEQGFTPENLELATVLAVQLGLALENLRAAEKQKALFFKTIRALVTAVSMREPAVLGHAERVANYARAICDQLDLSLEERSRIQIAALLHNIGKIAASDDELREINRDSDAARMEQVKLSEKIIKQIGGLDFVLPGIKHTYEHFDGTGIPDGLKAGKIPLMARIIAVANDFDKMTAITGDEGEPMLLKAALEKLRKTGGKELDPDIVTTLTIAYKKGTLFETAQPTL